MSIIFQPETIYRVKLTRFIKWKEHPLLPLPAHYLTGAELLAIIEKEGADVVDSAIAR